MKANTLKITFKQRDDHRDAAEKRLRRAQAGETGEAVEQDVRFVLNFEEYGDVEQLMRERNLKLIEAIVEHQPESIQDAATVVDRDYRDVHRNLEELESLGVVEFEVDGQRKKPQLREGVENVDFSFQFPLHTAADAGASAD
ncbi:transcriptional regulator [Haloarcula salinisoli]|uniref:Transcriptional regulator n=1 Tax=Haloarcula salinisoli TaxID=2487746 RepID=A0A8J8C947_9EURY|nr:transcriptional regulator [Halomicroarcula salinisoli]MBX0288102.1 transcriptional regulator [Halomicroarcula salinisoli]MBX0305231.1 transcriptional regulator [Halomicroarcula salinisoli]